MICCDVCEDWFHGNCVGITVGQGKKMEREGREYVCPVCLQRQHMTKEEAAASRYTWLLIIDCGHPDKQVW